jgi:hypothetical protein
MSTIVPPTRTTPVAEGKATPKDGWCMSVDMGQDSASERYLSRKKPTPKLGPARRELVYNHAPATPATPADDLAHITSLDEAKDEIRRLRRALAAYLEPLHEQSAPCDGQENADPSTVPTAAAKTPVKTPVSVSSEESRPKLHNPGVGSLQAAAASRPPPSPSFGRKPPPSPGGGRVPPASPMRHCPSPGGASRPPPSPRGAAARPPPSPGGAARDPAKQKLANRKSFDGPGAGGASSRRKSLEPPAAPESPGGRQMVDKRSSRKQNKQHFQSAISKWQQENCPAAAAAAAARAAAAAARAAAAADCDADADAGADTDADADEFQDGDVFLEDLDAADSDRTSLVSSSTSTSTDVRVFIRKRPLFEEELEDGEFDTVTMDRGGCTGSAACFKEQAEDGGRAEAAPRVLVHDCKMHPDLRHMFLKTTSYPCTRCFDSDAGNRAVYTASAAPLVDIAAAGGIATVFMYGQTGSGKTHTMSGIEDEGCAQLFQRLGERTAAARAAVAAAAAAGGAAAAAEPRARAQETATVHLRFFELVGKKVVDLLARSNANGADGAGAGGAGAGGAGGAGAGSRRAAELRTPGGGAAGAAASPGPSSAAPGDAGGGTTGGSTPGGTTSGGGGGSSEFELALREDAFGNVVVCGAAEEPAADCAALLALIRRAKASRAQAATARNKGTEGAGGGGSSRSHAVCQIVIRYAPAAGPSPAAGADEAGGAQRRSARPSRAGKSSGYGSQARAPSTEGVGVLTLVDCAGTERKEDSARHCVQRQREAAEINGSLHALKECIRARAKGSAVIPFRGSTLTKVRVWCACVRVCGVCVCVCVCVVCVWCVRGCRMPYVVCRVSSRLTRHASVVTPESPCLNRHASLITPQSSRLNHHASGEVCMEAGRGCECCCC